MHQLTAKMLSGHKSFVCLTHLSMGRALQYHPSSCLRRATVGSEVPKDAAPDAIPSSVTRLVLAIRSYALNDSWWVQADRFQQ